MARPKKDPANVRIPVSVRMTPTQIALLKQKKEEAGARSISEFIIAAALNTTVSANPNGCDNRKTRQKAKPPIVNPDLQKAVRYLSSISNNMNQVALRINADSKANKITDATYITVLEQLSLFQQMLRQVG